jgi:hypothetical protein
MQDPDAPFADVGPALKRLLALGASRQDLSLVCRFAVYIDLSTQSITCDFHYQADGEGSNVVFDDDGKHVVDASWKGSHFVRTLDGKITFREVFIRRHS